MTFLWAPDVAYDGGDLDRPGPRHRIEVVDRIWTLMRDGAAAL
jgi:hypothetical protein